MNAVDGRGKGEPTEVLCIHGTWAAKPEDEGEAWWQRGSPFWAKLNEALDPVASCGPSRGRVFHWTGSNEASARGVAAVRLLEDHLLPRERDGSPYAVVAHSHGGSVVRRCLAEAARRGVQLDNLQAVVSVGTPFLRARAPLSAWWTFVPFAIAWMAVVGAWRDVGGVFLYSSSIFENGDLPGAISVVLVWSLLALAGLALASSVIGVLASLSRRTWVWERRAERLYGARWLVLVSSEDEAVEGLQVAATLRANVIPRILNPIPSLLMPLRLTTGLVVWLINAVLIDRLANPVLNLQLASRALGDDDAGLETGAVAARYEECRATPRVQPNYGAIASLASTRLGDTLGDARRELLGSLYVGSLWELAGRAKSLGRLTEGLVHCSYFDEDSVVAAVADYVRHAAKGVDRDEPATGAEDGTSVERYSTWRPRFLLAAILSAMVLGLWALAAQLARTSVHPHDPVRGRERILDARPLYAPTVDGTPMQPALAWSSTLAELGEAAILKEFLLDQEEYWRSRMIRNASHALARGLGLGETKALLTAIGAAADIVHGPRFLEGLIQAERYDDARIFATAQGLAAVDRCFYVAKVMLEVPLDGGGAAPRIDSQLLAALAEAGDGMDEFSVWRVGAALRRLHSAALAAEPTFAERLRSGTKRLAGELKRSLADPLDLHRMAMLQEAGFEDEAWEIFERSMDAAFAWLPRYLEGTWTYPSAYEVFAPLPASSRFDAWLDGVRADPNAGAAGRNWRSTRALAGALVHGGRVAEGVQWARLHEFVSEAYTFNYDWEWRTSLLQEMLEQGALDEVQTLAAELADRNATLISSSGRLFKPADFAAIARLLEPNASLEFDHRADLRSLGYERVEAVLDQLEDRLPADLLGAARRRLINGVDWDVDSDRLLGSAQRGLRLLRIGDERGARALARELWSKVESWRWGEGANDERVAMVALLAELGWFPMARRLAEGSSDMATGVLCMSRVALAYQRAAR